jgi:hypothetical protein
MPHFAAVVTSLKHSADQGALKYLNVLSVISRKYYVYITFRHKFRKKNREGGWRMMCNGKRCGNERDCGNFLKRLFSVQQRK